MPGARQLSNGYSYWPIYVLGILGVVWLLQEAKFLQLSLPLGPISVVWASLALLLFAKQSKR